MSDSTPSAPSSALSARGDFPGHAAPWTGAAATADGAPASANVSLAAEASPDGDAPPQNGATLREGFTTGSALAAAATAALRLLLRGGRAATVSVPLPPFSSGEDHAAPAGWLDVPVAEATRVAPMHMGAGAALGAVVKDGGDDPDATHGARIEALVECAAEGTALPEIGATPQEEGISPAGASNLPDLLLTFPRDAPPRAATGAAAPFPPPIAASSNGVTVLLRGGAGVGLVTLPGLPVAVGEPAINPEPRRQLAFAMHHECAAAGWRGTVRVTARVPEGQRIARHTLNPRLGIVGGISILGTRGTVRPYSHDAWQAAVAQGLDVARAAGLTEVCLSTGRRSETLLMRAHPALPQLAFVQAADFAAFSLAAAAQRGFTRVAWGCFFGKLVKLAQGLPHTHAHTAPLDLPLLAQWALDAGAGKAACAHIAAANTAGQALEILLADPAHPAVLRHVAERARATAHRWTGGTETVTVTVHLFHMDGRCLVTA
ncbi:cobalt-precorrin-5B (C(1))-methyltransferase CbiD [Nitratidesulfovibrio sp. HK-II]|uniref:cobalt-precorrin-5B (C(1))-methyltransferase CbiD n=1 Tax=Nitratidesulfovibrio sp. HK-II TaxID=2009266 RepID=UPI000E2E640F|nr:cobalt-precorrin-5B (C(1))-methyltransferase CbiD [Nitratidesulfovibrio sp. HK-II]GBO95177.1 cobalt-precorrin-6 synthase, anaerobic [Nitratidesulfovibrio sp. HK-II]